MVELCHLAILTSMELGADPVRNCMLENGSREELAGRGLQRPAIAVITGMRKPWRTVFSDRDYQRVRELGDEHRRNYPRAPSRPNDRCPVTRRGFRRRRGDCVRLGRRLSVAGVIVCRWGRHTTRSDHGVPYAQPA
jgi:hypothetical protein